MPKITVDNYTVSELRLITDALKGHLDTLNSVVKGMEDRGISDLNIQYSVGMKDFQRQLGMFVMDAQTRLYEESRSKSHAEQAASPNAYAPSTKPTRKSK